VDDFVEMYQRSPQFAVLKSSLDSKVAGFEQSATLAADAMRLLKPAKTKDRFANGFMRSFVLLSKRQCVLTLRDKNMLGSLFGEAIFVGILMGGVFYNSARVEMVSMPRSGIGALFFCAAILQRQAWQQIPIMMDARPTFYKQRQRDFFQTLAFVVAFCAVQIPVNVAAMLIFCPIVYFMTGYHQTASNFLFFLLTMTLLQHALRSIFLAVGAATRSASSAQYSASLLVASFLLFSGYILSFDLIPVYWQWAYFINPLAYGLRSLTLNEYQSAKYTQSQTDSVLATYGFTNQATSAYMWAGPALFVVYYFFFNTITALCLHFIRYDGVKAKAALVPVEPETATVDLENGTGVGIDQGTFDVEGHEFVPVTIAFKNVDYTVFPPKLGKDGIQLLHDVGGVFRPGRMTALMGASGAGKTTLMDVIAGRKNTGKVEGKITINGVEASPSDFSKISGYCEQMDVHSPEATVREAFLFSAALRQPEEVCMDEKRRFVEHTIDILELHAVADRLIGESALVGLTVEQRKRVTIGVELAANPAVIFADEPTSGLDARAAMVVMRALRRISSANRTVVCTIHQPNTHIFEMFDDLLLLQKGGITIYNGELGRESAHLIRYFEVNGAPPICDGENPANYMLSVIGAGIEKGGVQSYVTPNTLGHSSRNSEEEDSDLPSDQDISNNVVHKQRDFGIVYKTSKMKQQMDEQIDVVFAEANPDAVRRLLAFPNGRAHATSVCFQLKECSRKAFTTYWRTPQYNVKRLIVLGLLASMFGTAYLFAGPLFPINSVEKARSFAALIYLCMDFVGILNMVTVLPVTFRERSVYYRERAAQTYSSRAYMFSIFCVELPYLVFTVSVFVLIMYFLIGLHTELLGYFLLVFWLYVSLCTYFGQLIAIATPNEIVGQVLVGFLTVVMNLFSGYLVSRPNIPVVLRWVMYVSPSSYAFNGLASTQLAYCPEGTTKYNGCQTITSNASMPFYNKTVEYYAQETFSLDLDSVYDRDIPVLVSFWVLTLALCAFSLKYIKHDTK